jgi:hypothetical protein
MKQKRKSTKNVEKKIAEFLEHAKKEQKPLRVPDLEISEREFIENLIKP